MTTKGKVAGFVLIVAFIVDGSSAQVHIMVHSTARAPADVGQSVFLACEFHRPGNCFWTRNAEVVTIYDGNKYFDIGEDIQRMNCFIGITKVEEEDAGNWTCAIEANPNEEGKFSKSAYLHVKGNDKVSNSEISPNEPNPPVTQTAYVIAAMVAVIVILAIIIAAGIMYILRLRRAKAGRQHSFETISQSLLYADTAQPVQNVTEVITEPRRTSTTETGQGYLMPRQIQMSRNAVYVENSSDYHTYNTIPE